MSIIYVLLAISVTVALIFFAAFVFSVKSGQLIFQKLNQSLIKRNYNYYGSRAVLLR